MGAVPKPVHPSTHNNLALLMEPTTITFYFDVVFFFYGLSFILLGIVISVRPKEESSFDLARFIWLLAGFALVHGLLEWMYLWKVVRGDNQTLELARPSFVLFSYIFLFEFGRRLVVASHLPESQRMPLKAVLSPASLVVLLFGIMLAVGFSDEKTLALDIWSGYLLGFTGASLTGCGFLYYCNNRIRPALIAMDFPPIRHACQMAGVTFLVYGILGGLVVPRSDWFPPVWLNQDSFNVIVGMPVQILRTGCSILIALSATQLLWLFHIETHQRLLQSLADTEVALSEVRRLRHRDELLLSSVAEGICGFDVEGKIVFINSSALKMLGYTEEELLGQIFDAPAAQVAMKDDDKFELGVVQQVLLDGQTHWGELSTLKRKDGSSFPVEYRAAPIIDEAKLSGAVVTFQDITERKQAQDDLDANHKTLNAITSSTRDAIIMIDDEGDISFWNQGAEAMFGYPTGESLGRNLHELIVPERFLSLHREAFPAWRKTGTGSAVGRTLELVGVRNGGQEFPIELSLSSVRLRHRWFAVGIARDITLRKQQEELLSQAKQAAESANRAKSEFLANMSHEIRTPMNAILGLIQLVLDSPLTPRQDDFLRKAHASSRALLNILNDILDYSKIEAGRLAIEQVPFRIDETLKSVADLHAAQMAEKSLELFLEIEPDVPVAVLGDSLRLTQVLNNLVGNAVKFTERGEIHIKAAVTGVVGGVITLQFAVRDTGIGLEKEQALRLFQPFTQGDGSITRKFGGTGLGLTICQRLVGLMGGEIAVSSLPGQGSCFTFTISVGASASLLKQPDMQQLGDCKVLVVDDQETSRLILKQLFDAWGLESHTAASGSEALAQIEEAEVTQRPFNAILLDWRMPEMSGLEVARRLQEEAHSGRFIHPLLVVMIMAYDKDELLGQIGSIHLDGILTKPVTPSDLFDVLANARNPQPPTPAVVEKGTESLPSDFKGSRILLVEDNAINQQVAAEFLRMRKINVILANHGGEAVDWVKRESFDAVLMDLHMPTMDGLEATRRIRDLPNGRDLPIIAMTAAVMPEDRERCAACGMVGFVSKPIDPNELTRVLQSWIKPGGESSPTDERPRPTITHQHESVLPDAIPGFDLGPALERLGGNRDLLARLLLDFAEGQSDALTQLDALLDAGETSLAMALLHRLKGVAANLGITELALSAQQLEWEIKASKPLNSRSAFSDALASAMAAIASLPQAGNDFASSEGLDRMELAELLRSLVPYLREREVVPDAYIQTLYRLAQNDLTGGPLATLIHKMDLFDYAGALTVINPLAKTLGLELPL